MLRSAVVKSQVRSCGKHDRQLAARNTSAITLQIPGLSKHAIGMFLDRKLEISEDLDAVAMTKPGWRDAGTQRLTERLAEIGLPPGTVQTMFEFIDLDEGRRPAGPR